MTTARQWLTLWLAQLALAACVLSCKSGDTVSAPVVAGIQIIPNTAAVLDVGGTRQLTANVVATDGNPLSSEVVTWSSSEPSIATVSTSGLVTALATGNATISAACSGRVASVAVEVEPAVAFVTVEFNQPQMTLAPGGALSLYASAEDASDATLTDTISAWSTSNAAVATVTATGPHTGRVTGVAAGSVTITATIGGVPGAVTLQVDPQSAVTSIVILPRSAAFVAGPLGYAAPIQFSAQLQDVFGNSVAGAIAWSSSDTTAATISATGLVTPNLAVASAANTASTTITATSGSISAATLVIVNPQVAAVSITPSSLMLAVGQVAVLHTTATSAARDTLTGVRVGWSSVTPLDHQVARISGGGADSLIVTGVAEGTAMITATEPVGGVKSTIQVTVSGSLAAKRSPISDPPHHR